MNTVGWLLILFAGLLIDAVRRGRADDLPEDIRDSFVALVTLDGPLLRDVSGRKGEALTPVEVTPDDATAPATNNSGSALLAEAQKLGSAAKGYKLSYTGPDYYDCSGLVWRAMRNIGVYKGSRFTVRSFTSAMGTSISETSSPAVGDIVVWVNRVPAHMGIVSGNGRFYSARSTKSGIGELAISDLSGSPRYYRLVK